MPQWLETTAIFLLAQVVSWAACYLVFRLGLRALGRVDEFWATLLRRARGPVQWLLMVIAGVAAMNIAPLTPGRQSLIAHILLIALILGLTWLARRALDIWMTLHLRRFRLDVEDNLLARKHVTQGRILQRVGGVLILAIGVSAALMTIEGVRQYGVSLLASAGAAGLVVGLALQPVLRNLLAGIQLAITQPIRIDDAVIVEGEWGNVEEITATYVVVRVWDKRRLVVPLNHFIEQSFENWTRSDATLIGTVLLYVDHEVSIPDLRAEAERIVRASPLWNGDVFALQVTDFRETVVEVRILASATHAGRAFDLRCEIRERLLDYLQSSQPQAIPRLRATLREQAAG